MLSRESRPFLLKEVSVIITASVTVLMMEWAVYSMFAEIDSFEKNMRAELEEFEMFFNLSSKFFVQEIPERYRIRRANTVNREYPSSYGTYGALSYAMPQSGDVPEKPEKPKVEPKCPGGGPGGPGYNGEPGFDGVPGVDGQSGVDGLYMQKDSYRSCVRCPQGPPGIPGSPGAEGPRGQPGAVGSAGSAPYATPMEPGAAGPPGDSGRPGRDGVPGPSGMPGLPGRRCLPGAPGRGGIPGPMGPPGRDGETPPQAERGQPGPRGTQGVGGRKGNDGANGLNGTAGDRGQEGQDGLYCLCPARPPLESHYVTTITTTPPPPILPDPSSTTVHPPAKPYAEPGNAITVRSLTTRSTRDDGQFPQPPPFISIEGASLGPPNEIVEDISMEVTPPSGGWASIKWSDMLAMRRKKWQQRLEVDNDSALVIKRHLEQDSTTTKVPRRPLTIEAYDSDGEMLLDKDWIVINPRRLARLRLGAVRGSLRVGTAGDYAAVGEYARPPAHVQDTVVDVE